MLVWWTMQALEAGLLSVGREGPGILANHGQVQGRGFLFKQYLLVLCLESSAWTVCREWVKHLIVQKNCMSAIQLSNMCGSCTRLLIFQQPFNRSCEEPSLRPQIRTDLAGLIMQLQTKVSS